MIVAAITIVGIGLATSPAYAVNEAGSGGVVSAACTNAADCVKSGVATAGGTGATGNLGDLIKKIVNVLLFVLGAVAVIMIVIGGFKYVVSNGDSSAVTSAKNTIMYAVIGLIVALLAYAIVNFVITSFIA